MTKDELISLLQADPLPGDTVVLLAQPKHDYWNSVSIVDVSNLEAARVEVNGNEEIDDVSGEPDADMAKQALIIYSV